MPLICCFGKKIREEDEPANIVGESVVKPLPVPVEAAKLDAQKELSFSQQCTADLIEDILEGLESSAVGSSETRGAGSTPIFEACNGWGEVTDSKEVTKIVAPVDELFISKPLSRRDVRMAEDGDVKLSEQSTSSRDMSERADKELTESKQSEEKEELTESKQSEKEELTESKQSEKDERTVSKQSETDERTVSKQSEKDERTVSKQLEKDERTVSKQSEKDERTVSKQSEEKSERTVSKQSEKDDRTVSKQSEENKGELVEKLSQGKAEDENELLITENDRTENASKSSNDDTAEEVHAEEVKVIDVQTPQSKHSDIVNRESGAVVSECGDEASQDTILQPDVGGTGASPRASAKSSDTGEDASNKDAEETEDTHDTASVSETVIDEDNIWANGWPIFGFPNLLPNGIPWAHTASGSNLRLAEADMETKNILPVDIEQIPASPIGLQAPKLQLPQVALATPRVENAHPPQFSPVLSPPALELPTPTIDSPPMLPERLVRSRSAFCPTPRLLQTPPASQAFVHPVTPMIGFGPQRLSSFVPNGNVSFVPSCTASFVPNGHCSQESCEETMTFGQGPVTVITTSTPPLHTSIVLTPHSPLMSETFRKPIPPLFRAPSGLSIPVFRVDKFA